MPLYFYFLHPSKCRSVTTASTVVCQNLECFRTLRYILDIRRNTQYNALLIWKSNKHEQLVREMGDKHEANRVTLMSEIHRTINFDRPLPYACPEAEAVRLRLRHQTGCLSRSGNP